MARYSRRTGPATNFELIATDQIIPGLSITRFYDDGELLISDLISVQNNSVGPVVILGSAQVDGADVLPQRKGIAIDAGSGGSLSNTILVSISQGLHTITLNAQGDAAVGDVVLANSSHLSVIQLPRWDSDRDIL